MPRSIFKQPPTDILILKAVRSLGITNLTDTKIVDESALNPILMQEVLEELRGIYYPCMIKTFLERDSFEYKNYICIVRQLLKTRKRNLLRREKCIMVGKNLYKYESVYSLDLAPISELGEVTFN